VEAFKEAEVCYRKALQSRCRRLKVRHMHTCERK